MPPKIKRVALSQRAFITFPVGKTLRMLKHSNICPRVSPRAAVAHAACLNYLIKDIFESIDDSMKQQEEGSEKNGLKRISTRWINLVLRKDPEFIPLLRNVHIKKSGVVPIVFKSKKQKALERAHQQQEQE